MATATTKKITEIEVSRFVDPETDPAIYIENNGVFQRAKGNFAREAVGLGGIVVSEGMLCVEMEE